MSILQFLNLTFQQLCLLAPITELQAATNGVAVDGDCVAESLLLQLHGLRKKDFQLKRQAERVKHVVKVVQRLCCLVKAGLDELMEVLDLRATGEKVMGESSTHWVSVCYCMKKETESRYIYTFFKRDVYKRLSLDFCQKIRTN